MFDCDRWLAFLAVDRLSGLVTVLEALDLAVKDINKLLSMWAAGDDIAKTISNLTEQVDTRKAEIAQTIDKDSVATCGLMIRFSIFLFVWAGH